jgi:RNA polymerase sigma factor (sigma-70 family)
MPTPLRHMTDQQLVAELPLSEAAFTEIYCRYWDKLLVYAAMKLRNTALAEEAVQEIFLDVWRRKSTLTINGSLEAYFSVAVKYRVINIQARLKREREFLNDQGEQTVHTEWWLDEKEINKNYQLLVSGLPEKCRITYKLSREEGLSLKEIAQRMAISQKAVEANLSRSLKLLRFGLRRLLFTIFYANLLALSYQFF